MITWPCDDMEMWCLFFVSLKMKVTWNKFIRKCIEHIWLTGFAWIWNCWMLATSNVLLNSSFMWLVICCAVGWHLSIVHCAWHWILIHKHSVWSCGCLKSLFEYLALLHSLISLSMELCNLFSVDLSNVFLHGVRVAVWKSKFHLFVNKIVTVHLAYVSCVSLTVSLFMCVY